MYKIQNFTDRLKQKIQDETLSCEDVEYMEFVSYQQEKLENKELGLDIVVNSAGMVV